jgi:hypothetical protein
VFPLAGRTAIDFGGGVTSARWRVVCPEAPNDLSLYARRGGRTAADHGEWVIISDPIGPWVPFSADVNWTDNTLRQRLILNSRKAELDGRISGELAPNALAQIGTLAPGFRPLAGQNFSVSINTGLQLSVGVLEILAPAGDVYIRPLAPMTFVDIHVTWPLD